MQRHLVFLIFLCLQLPAVGQVASPSAKASLAEGAIAAISPERLRQTCQDCPGMMLPEARPAMIAWLGMEDALADNDLKALHGHAKVVAAFFKEASPKLANQARILAQTPSLELADKEFRQLGAMFRKTPPGQTEDPGRGKVKVF